MSGSNDNGANSGSRLPKGLSRRKFLLGSAATAAGAAVAVNSERANAFFNTFGFMKKSAGSGQTSNGYTIGQSLRFDGSNTYMTRTFAGGSGTTWTLSLWCKRASLSSVQGVFGAGTTGAVAEIYFDANDRLRVAATNSSGSVILDRLTNRVFRDPSAFMHIVIALNNSSICQIWINGAEETSFSASVSPSAGTALPIGSNVEHQLGRVRYYGGAWTSPLSGYLADVNFIDGQPLDASSFGQIDTQTGQWIPKAYSGSCGTNGFYLKFADNSNATAATLGKDSSPNGNNWTPNGLQTYDQVLDSPTNNFCTLNLLDRGSSLTLTNGGLTALSAASGSPECLARGTIGVTAGKWYFEARLDTQCSPTDALPAFGICRSTAATSGTAASVDHWTFWAGATSSYAGKINHNGTWAASGTSFTTPAAGDIYMFAFDMSSGGFWVGKGGTWFNSGAPASNTGALFSDISGVVFPFCDGWGSSQGTMNFGQGGQAGLTYDSASGGQFKYTPPAGFKALCTTNLAVPTIKSSSQYFNTLTWTGDGATPRTITGLGFQPDMVWSATRNVANGNWISDVVRGANIKIFPSATNADEVSGASGYINAFTSSGFTVQNGSSSGQYVNASGNTYVAWCWKAGTSGTYTSSYTAESYNATSGFSVIKYVGLGSGTGVPKTLSHSLGKNVAFAIFKETSQNSGDGWPVFHQNAGAGNTNYLLLNDTGAAGSQGAVGTVGYFIQNGSASINLSDWHRFNGAGITYIAYLWAEVAGFSRFGSYTGNGSSDGPFVYCGFKPRFVMIKCASAASLNWDIADTARSMLNPVSYAVKETLRANTSDAETTGGGYVPSYDILSNGFKIRSGTASEYNTSGATYIFAAFAEAPFKYATAR